MNHDPKYNEFEYEKENYPKTPEHFKQFVAAQVTKELSKASIVKHRARKKYFPAKVAAAVIVCAAVGTTGAYAGVKQYQARSQQYLQETGRITAPETSSEEETPAISDNTDSVSPATIVSEENGLITTFSDTWPDVMLEMYDYDSEYQKPWETGFFLIVLSSMIRFIWLPGTSMVSMVTDVTHNINAVHSMLR